MPVMFGMQAERALWLTAQADATAAQTTATQRLQEQLDLTMAEEKKVSKAESELADSTVQLQAALRAAQVSFGSPLCNNFTAVRIVFTVYFAQQC